MTSDPYVPEPAFIDEIRSETDDTKTFTIRIADDAIRDSFEFKPGQFVQVTAYGVGESPISICSSPATRQRFQISVRRIGRTTTELHECRVGERVGIRGPFGNGWPLETMRGRDVLAVAGGIGLAPIRSLIESAIDSRESFGKIVLCYGARNPLGLLYKSDYARWSKEGIEVLLTVDSQAEGWVHDVGVVTSLLDKVHIQQSRALAITCGPPVMIKFTIRQLMQLRYPPQHIYASLESMMKCGVGKCGHCHFGNKHVCLDGPIFRYDEMVNLPRGLAPL